MNKKIVVSADCICDLPENLLKKYSIPTIPFYVSINGARFQDYNELDSSSILEYLEDDEMQVSSSPPTIEEYKSFFENQTEKEKNVLIHISVSNKLSKAYYNALKASENIADVYVIDSGAISHGMGIFVLEAARLARKNATLEIMLEELLKIREKINCTFIIKTTQYIAANNRLNQTISNLISLFRIKPIIKLKPGKLKVSGTAFGGKTLYVRKYIKRTLRNKRNISDKILFISFSGCSEELCELVYKEVSEKIDWKNIYTDNISATNFCNIGSESVGLMFFNK